MYVFNLNVFQIIIIILVINAMLMPLDWNKQSGNTGFLAFHLCFSYRISFFIICFIFHPVIFVTLNQSGWKSHLSDLIYQEEPAMLIKFIHQLCQETHQQMIFTHVTLWHYLSSQKYQKDKIWQPEIFTLIDGHWCFPRSLAFSGGWRMSIFCENISIQI